MSGTLTITNYSGGPRDGEMTATRTGAGEPDVTVRVLYQTDMFGGFSVSKNIIGGPGDDLLAGDKTTFFLDGESGNDTITSVAGGGPFGWLVGGDGDDWLRGSASDDLLEPGPGNDTVDGGAGYDMVSYWEHASGVDVDLRISAPQQTGEGLDVLIGVEGVTGSDFADTLTGDDGPNLLRGGAGNDVVYGLGGNDTITDQGYYGDDWGTYHADPTADDLSGGDGDDWISGGEESDDLNGNQGNDTVHGDDGDDLLHGGQGQDSLNGNAGNDTAFGDLGADTVRGGQGDDVISGGAGDDWLSGDRGDDTVSGGAGADVFHSFGDAGVDRVTDFNSAEGDRVQLDPGTAFTVAQAGADTVISMAGGAQVVLVGVQLSSLPPSWIFEA